MICEGKLPLSNVPNNKSVYKFDSTLKPVWKKPQVFKTFIGAGVYSEEVNALSYTNPADGSTVDYLAEGRNFYQVLPD